MCALLTLRGRITVRSIVRCFLIAVMTWAVLFGTVPTRAANAATEAVSSGTALDTSTSTLPGSMLWERRYIRQGNDEPTAVGVSPDGSEVFVTGASAAPATSLDYATVAYDASTGDALWSKRYTRPGSDAGYALGVSPDGSKIFVTGYSEGPTGGADYATLAYDASTGATLWSKRLTGPDDGNDYASELGVSPDGSMVFVTGYTEGSTTRADYTTVAYDSSSGATVWVRRYKSAGLDYPKALGVSPNGSTVFVTGDSLSAFVTVAYDASTGTKLWVKRYSSNDVGFASALGVSPDGSEVFVTGSSDDDYATLAYDATTGARLWLQRYDGPQNDTDVPTAIGVSPDGSKLFVTGSSDDWTRPTVYATVAYDTSTGETVWAKRYGPPGESHANALGLSPDGSTVFVTGQTFGSSGWDYATVAYDSSSGATSWAERYRRPWNDDAIALGVSPDGSKVFVAGSSEGSTRGTDYATVAYGTA
jgi:Tol biopolymer transport system component